MRAASSAKVSRTDNRLPAVLDAAARLFAARGYSATTMREIAEAAEPWARPEAGCVAHLETVLKRSDYAQVLIRVVPGDVPAVAARLAALRAEYEDLWRDLVAALPLPAHSDRRTLRLMWLGALNWSRFWYRENGRDSPRQIARRFIRLLRERQDPDEEGGQHA